MNVFWCISKRFVTPIALLWFIASFASAQFADEFEGPVLNADPRGMKGWTFYTGEGEATITFSASGKGYASICVDATKDTRGIWWALVRRYISSNMNLSVLKNSRYALRIDTRIRVSDAPKRINLHLNMQRTTDFHSHLMEFDIPDTIQWHTISMTAKNFDVVPGDSIYGQLALMDWGFERYRVDIDYFRVNIVQLDSAGADQGIQVPYHPPIPDVRTFALHLPVAANAMLDRQYPDMNYHAWSIFQDSSCTRVLTVGESKNIVMRWNMDSLKGKKAKRAGVLELTTASLQRLSQDIKDFGIIRVVEILDGDPRWQQGTVTYSSFFQNRPFRRVFNSQMIIDVEVNTRQNGKTYATISQPVLQRLIDGKTLGIALLPLGAVEASFYSLESARENAAPLLHCQVE